MNDTLASSMTYLATLCDGSMGWAILLLALAARLALLPLTLRLSRKMLANQHKMQALRPQLEAIRARLKDDPKAMFAATGALYKEHGVKVFDRSSIVGSLLQLPVFALLYRTIRAASSHGSFMWIRSLALPDATLTAIVLLLTAAAAWLFPSASDPSILMVAVQVVFMAFMVWKLSAGLGLYWAASSGVNLVQTLVLRRERQRAGHQACAS